MTGESQLLKDTLCCLHGCENLVSLIHRYKQLVIFFKKSNGQKLKIKSQETLLPVLLVRNQGNTVKL